MDWLFNSGWQFIVDKLTGAFAPVLDYLYIIAWFAAGAGVIAACLFIGFWLPFKWVRVSLGLIVTYVGVALAVAWKVWSDMRSKPKPKTAPPKEQNPWRW